MHLNKFRLRYTIALTNIEGTRDVLKLQLLLLKYTLKVGTQLFCLVFFFITVRCVLIYMIRWRIRIVFWLFTSQYICWHRQRRAIVVKYFYHIYGFDRNHLDNNFIIIIIKRVINTHTQNNLCKVEASKFRNVFFFVAKNK